MKDPAYHVKRRAARAQAVASAKLAFRLASRARCRWLDRSLRRNATSPAPTSIRFDHGQKTYALYRDARGQPLRHRRTLHARQYAPLRRPRDRRYRSSAPSTTAASILIDGSPARAPICRGLATYPVEERDGQHLINVSRAGGAGARAQQTYRFRVVSNRSVATFIKELVLEPLKTARRKCLHSRRLSPARHSRLRLRSASATSIFPNPSPRCGRTSTSSTLWPQSRAGRRNNYSLASNPQTERAAALQRAHRHPASRPGLRSRRRAQATSSVSGRATPSPPLDLSAIFTSSPRSAKWSTSAAAPAWLRCALTSLTCLRPRSTARKISFWYGARSKQEIFYEDYFRNLAATHRNFSFHLALSSPLAEDNWTGPVGFIHEVVLENYLRNHPEPSRCRILPVRPAHDDQGLQPHVGFPRCPHATNRLRRVLKRVICDIFRGKGISNGSFLPKMPPTCCVFGYISFPFKQVFFKPSRAKQGRFRRE